MQVRDTSREMIEAARTAPYLERGQERELAIRWKENKDQDALNQIAVAHIRLVMSMAAKFRGFGLPSADLIQEGHVGLLEAAARFDPYRDIRFSTYATWWIRAAMQDYVLRNWSIVRGGTSSAQKSLFFNLRRLRARIAGNGQPPPTAVLYAQISAALGVSKSDVELMDARLSGPDTSLNAPAGADETAASDRMDFLVSEDPLPDEATGNAIDSERRQAWLQSALEVLNERELRIIRERRLSDDTTTLETLGTMLGISKERVRQIECRALEKLKHSLIARNPDMASHSF